METLDSRPMNNSSIRSSLPNRDNLRIGQGRSDHRDSDDSTEKKEYHLNRATAGKPTVRKADGKPWKDVGESKCRAVMERIGVFEPSPKGGPIPTGKPSQESLKNPLHKAARPGKAKEGHQSLRVLGSSLE